MKTMYVCERCGAQFSSWEEAEACERIHLSPTDDMDEELSQTLVFRQGKALPEQLAIAFKKHEWNKETERYEDSYLIGVYALKKQYSEAENEDAVALYNARLQKEKEDAERWRREYTERLEKKKAEEKAKAEQEAAQNEEQKGE